MGSYQQTWNYSDGGYSGPPPGMDSGPPPKIMAQYAQAKYQRRTRVKGVGLPAIFAIVFAIVVIGAASVYLFAFDGINQVGEFFQPPTTSPTSSPTTTDQFSLSPTSAPTRRPTNLPTNAPTDQPTNQPSDSPTPPPVDTPTDEPSPAPSDAPTPPPTDLPTGVPSRAPSDSPTPPPTDSPTGVPSRAPSDSPTPPPTDLPTGVPSPAPSDIPTDAPTKQPTNEPTLSPTTPPPTSSNPFIVVTFLADAGIPLNIRNTAEAAFLTAAQRWTDIIGNTVVTPFNVGSNTFADAGCDFDDGAGGSVDPGPFPQSILDRVHIAARIAPDDGVGGTLGFAGPCGVVTDIPASGQLIGLAGIMSFDSDDIGNLIAAGELEDVILHEMGHVLGIGTLWNILGNGLLQDPVFSGNPLTGNPNADPQFVGVDAVAEHVALGETGNIPVEDGTFVPLSDAQIIALQGRGSIDGHWREIVFVNELMTPAIGGNNNPLSRMTIASLADLGYAVDLTEADAYAVPRTATEGGPALAKSSGQQFVMQNDIYISPRFQEEWNQARQKMDRSQRLLRGKQ